jgi:hypothetical protein
MDVIDKVNIASFLQDTESLIQDERFGFKVLFDCRSGVGEEVYTAKKKYRGLYTRLNGNKLTIINSLHKFYHGHNAGDFTYSQLREAIFEIADAYGVYPDQMKLEKDLEIGVNLSLLHPPSCYYSNMLTGLNSKEFFPMPPRNRYRGNIYGVKCQNSTLTMKNYDKTADVRQTDRLQCGENILRSELGIHNFTQYAPFIVTLADLLEKDKFVKLAHFFEKQFLTIVMKKSLIHFADLKPRELKDMFMLLDANDTQYIEMLKAGPHPHSAKTERRKMIVAQKRLQEAPDEIADELKQAFSEKLLELIEG